MYSRHHQLAYVVVHVLSLALQGLGLPCASVLQAVKTFEDETLAYKFTYPTQTASGQPLHLVVTRRPEKVCRVLSCEISLLLICQLAMGLQVVCPAQIILDRGILFWWCYIVAGQTCPDIVLSAGMIGVVAHT